MSLSQQYAGKILTPWFGLMEWKETKENIFSNSIQSQRIALNRLKVWKLRTPLLSTGVEGTIILLEALLEKEKNLTSLELAQMFSTALLRFLNICAANSERQGTFYKTAEKNELPYWLITLRHDIAHGHKLPSEKILQSALKVCLDWIKQKYWDIQESYMQDYKVSCEVNFKEFVSTYAHLNLSCYFNENRENLILELQAKMCDMIVDDDITSNELIKLLEEKLLQLVNQDKIRDCSSLIISALVDDNVILKINSLTVNGFKRIPPTFIQIWHKIINLLYENCTLFGFVNELADITEKVTCDHSVKEIASLWIYEIYQGLLKTKRVQEEYETVKLKHSEVMDRKTAHLILLSACDSNPTYKNTLTFDVTVELPFEDSKLFQERILVQPNKYTANFLESMLQFNGFPKDFIKAQYKEFKDLVQVNPSFYINPNLMYSVSDLEELEKTTCKEEITYHQNDTEHYSEKRKKFRKLTASEKDQFKGYPLGLCGKWGKT